MSTKTRCPETPHWGRTTGGKLGREKGSLSIHKSECKHKRFTGFKTLSLSGVWNGTPVVFHRFEGKCVDGEKGVSAKMVGAKRTKTKLCRRDKNSRGLVFVQVLQLSLSGSLSCAALSGKKKKREKEAESSQFEQL